MTLLERISAPSSAPSIDTRLFESMRSVPGAVGLAVAHYPSGTHGILVVDARNGAFLDAEEAAMEGLLDVRRQFVDSAIELLVLPASEADTLDVGPDVHIYPYV